MRHVYANDVGIVISEYNRIADFAKETAKVSLDDKSLNAIGGKSALVISFSLEKIFLVCLLSKYRPIRYSPID